VRHVIFVTRLNALSIDPDNGTVRWKFRFGAPGPTVNAATPQVVDGYLFLSASYGIGAVCRKIGKTAAEPVWDNNDTMSSQFSTSVPYEGYLYGVDGRQDMGRGRLRCFDPKTGKVQWTEEQFPIANLIVADGKLLIVTDDGELRLGRATPKACPELARARLAESTTRALPALANGLLYVRDATSVKCVDLRRAK
ncbi:MAG TPA: PQQ-binding-like beta-propeller repeat protein, partial [Planctomycetaceae bacterium]